MKTNSYISEAIASLITGVINKTEWVTITLIAVIINACLSPNYIVDINIVRDFIKGRVPANF